MLIHYLKIAFRNLSRNKVFSIINILGLAVGMGVCLLIYQYIHFELSFDRFHSNANNIYRLTQTNINQKGKGAASVGAALGPACTTAIPEILDYVRVHPQWRAATVINPQKSQPYEEAGILYVDENFLTAFNFPLLSGNAKTVLADIQNVVISESMSAKYFGSEEAIGKVLKICNEWEEKNYMVSGVLSAIPANSQLQFDFLLPLDVLLEKEQYSSFLGSWGYNNFTTYVTLVKEVDIDHISAEVQKLEAATIPTILERFNVKFKTTFQPLLDVHLRSDWRNDLSENNGSYATVRFFGLIAVFILIMAWVNSVNLSTARAIQRNKEVGIRKTIGAAKRQLITQFLVESFLVNLIAASIAIGLAILLMPSFAELVGKEMVFSVLGIPLFWLGFALIIVVGAIGSGLYPAFVLSAMKSISIYPKQTVGPFKGLSLRRLLIGFQFLCAMILISGTFLVYSQVNFMRGKDLGIDMEKILIINGSMADSDSQEAKEKFQTFKNQITNHHSVVSITSSGSIPGRGFDYGTQVHNMSQGFNGRTPAYFVYGDIDFTNTYDFKLLAGRLFSPDLITDNDGVLINETAVENFELGTADEAIGQSLIVKGVNNDTVKVLGVLADFHWQSVKDAHQPYLFALDNGYNVFYSIKLNLSDIPASLEYIESVYRSSFTENPFNYYFLDEDFNRQYQADLQFGNLFATFSALATFIACLGLFALVSFSATLRAKEIGIRKVLGAKIGHLMGLLSKEYLYLLLLANMLALPAVWYWGRDWLDNYAFKIDMGFDLFLIPGIVLLIISALTVSYQTFATATANPVDALRSE